MPTGLNRSARSACEHDRVIIPTVTAVGHVRRIEQQSVVEQTRTAFVDRSQYGDGFGEVARVLSMNLTQSFACDRIGVFDAARVPMMLKRVSVMLVTNRHDSGEQRFVTA